MSDPKSLFDAIQRRDLVAISETLLPDLENGLCNCGKIFEPLAVFHDIGCGYRVQEANDLRARLSLEQRDGQERVGANTWQDRDADEYGVNRTGEI